jgi:hypothetical protein
MLRFCLKKIFLGPLLGEIGLFCVYSDYAEQTNFGELGKNFLIFQISKVPLLYLLIIVFPKFDSLTAAGIALNRKMSHLFSLY